VIDTPVKYLKKLVPFFAKPILSKIHHLKDAYKGEDCYLIGDGISLKWFDLRSFTDKLSIPCGHLPFHKDFHILNIEQCLLIEPWCFYPWTRTTSPPFKIIKYPIQQSYRQRIKSNPSKQFIINLSNYPVISGKNIIYVFNDLNDIRLSSNFLSKRINCFEGSLRASILIAIYLGFNHAYLVGFDYTHLPARSRHWYEKGQGTVRYMNINQKEFFKIAKEFIDITTITLDGESEFLDYYTYENFFKNPPIFKENVQIVEESDLKALSSWPDFNIF